MKLKQEKANKWRELYDTGLSTELMRKLTCFDDFIIRRYYLKDWSIKKCAEVLEIDEKEFNNNIKRLNRYSDDIPQS